jgi:hypothetical protein
MLAVLLYNMITKRGGRKPTLNHISFVAKSLWAIKIKQLSETHRVSNVMCRCLCQMGMRAN